MPVDLKNYVSLGEFAEMSGVSVNELRDQIKMGRHYSYDLPRSRKIGVGTFFVRQEVESFLGRGT